MRFFTIKKKSQYNIYHVSIYVLFPNGLNIYTCLGIFSAKLHATTCQLYTTPLTCKYIYIIYLFYIHTYILLILYTYEEYIRKCIYL